MNKLRFLRFLFLSIMGITYVLTRQERYKWMFFYLSGSGKDRSLPAGLVPAKMVAAARGQEHYVPGSGTRPSCTVLSKGYAFHNNSMDYTGSGFSDRPEAFYLVGGMTWVVTYHKTNVTISGEDRYDWHPNEDGKFFTSPFSVKVIIAMMGRLFGNEYFPIAGYPSGEPGISNKLWMDLALVGAKEFTTTVNLTFSSKQWKKMLKSTKRKRRNTYL